MDDAQELVRLEVDLAKQEVKELVKSNLFAIAFFGVAAVFALFAMLTMLELVLVEVAGHFWGAGGALIGAIVVFVIYLLVAAILALLGRSRLQLHAPQKTINTLKETKEWAARQMKSPAK